MSDIFREVDEAYNRERAAKFFQRWGIWILLLVVALAAGAGFYAFDLERQRESRREATQHLADADAKPGAERAPALASAAEALPATAPARLVALLLAGDAAVEAGQGEEAARLYAQVDGDPAADPLLRDAALIKRTWLAVSAQALPETLRERVEALATGGGPLAPSAREALLLDAYQRRAPRAVSDLAALAGEATTPVAMRERLNLILTAERVRIDPGSAPPGLPATAAQPPAAQPPIGATAPAAATRQTPNAATAAAPAPASPAAPKARPRR